VQTSVWIIAHPHVYAAGAGFKFFPQRCNTILHLTFATRQTRDLRPAMMQNLPFVTRGLAYFSGVSVPFFSAISFTVG
jgi:hypothetical protein